MPCARHFASCLRRKAEIMIKNYFKIAWRVLAASRIYTVINILGLAVGVACFIFITLFILDELAYDRFHEQGERIYRVAGRYDQGGEGITEGATTTFQLAPLLEVQFPQIRRGVRIDPNYEQVVRYDDRLFREKGIMYADSGFFNMFSFEILRGDRTSPLSGGNVAVISSRLEKKYFGELTAVGRAVEINGRPVQIVAVMKPMPRNSHFHSDLVVAMPVIEDRYADWVRTDWSGTSHYTYIQLDEMADPNQVAAQLNRTWDEQLPDYADSHDFFLQPLTDIHLSSHLSYEIEANGDLRYLYIFGLVGIAILVIACINYTNLATARMIDRTREVGIRKVLGAGRNQIRVQFFSESILTALVAVLAGLFLAELLVPYINTLTGKAYALAWDYGWYWASGLLLLALLMGIFSGGYPALVVSAFDASGILKSGRSGTGTGSGMLRRSLVVVQFVASVAILVSTAVVFRQVHYISNKKLGINPSEVVVIPFQTAEVRDRYDLFRERLLANPDVVNVTATNNPLASRVTHWRDYKLENRDEAVTIPTMIVAHDFFETLQADFVAGRSYSRDFTTDETNAFIINEAAVKFLGLGADPVGVSIKGRAFTGSKWTVKDAEIIGVVKDFHLASMRTEIQPTVFSLSSDDTYPLSFMVVRLRGGNLSSGLAYLEQTWKEFTSEYPFDYAFMDQQIRRLYESEQRFLSMFSVFSLIALLVAVFGVFGLSAFAVSSRRKEIGIRKVLGSSGTDIIWLFVKEYVWLIVLANLVAWPVAGWFMRDWLTDFAYRIELSAWDFIGMGTVAGVTILVTVGIQALKAARMNPVESLRNE